jgi:hypothetical protein
MTIQKYHKGSLSIHHTIKEYEGIAKEKIAEA